MIPAALPPAPLDLPRGVPPLASLYIYAAGACNLACRHCWITPDFQPGVSDAPHGDGRYVQLDHVRSAIAQGRALGLRGVKLTGGEPTLHPHFRELVTLLAEAGVRIVVETNGTLVDDALAQYLRRSGKVGFVSVSLDGAEAAAHDTLRAVEGSFDRAVEGIRALRRAGFRPQIICSLYRGNAGQVGSLVALAEALGCESVKLNLIQEMGRGAPFNDREGLRIEEILALNQYVERHIVPATKLRVVFDIPLAFRPVQRLLRGKTEHCGVLGILGLLPGGELALCGVGMSIPELVYGHIGRDALREVWCFSPGLVELREKIPARLEGVCARCMHRDMCLGSCLANNYHRAGKINAAYQLCARAQEQGLFPPSRLVGAARGVGPD